MYIPTNCKTLADIAEQQIRLGIQGFGGTGKTYSGLTFPNPAVANIDRGLGAHSGRKDVIEIPFYDLSFCRSINPKHINDSSLRDTIMIWLDKEATKLEADQTLVWDGGTGTQNAYHKWYAFNPSYTKQGKEDEFAEWRLKLNFFGDICETFKRLKCHVVYICHEFEKPDKSGDYSGKIRPLLTGQFCNQLTSHFTDWVRQHASNKIAPDKIKESDLKNWDMTKDEFIAMQDTYPRNTIYYWQLESDDIFDGKISSLVNFPRFIPANYNSFKRYAKSK